ncbi:hypothetical protein [Bradyrhizobium sp. BWA-3-5]|uniref:hypothetical protein n=1 Tax=Bradyrhizobium sp. BWA-3-5 TaxID=3080013 RepID=UPI00293ECB1F|nr:hypothetical protein [Bradyrhizobium sp. BWA-3-5]WOH63388.1 hypothetical protein RX331_21910 [Bradyrhizobium sp. BWA-3-5]
MSQACSTQACSGGFDDKALRRSAAALRSSNRLYLAAAPTFAMMALLTAVLGDGSALCTVAGTSPLSGMEAMYLLMSVFHLPPWLKLIASSI